MNSNGPWGRSSLKANASDEIIQPAKTANNRPIVCILVAQELDDLKIFKEIDEFLSAFTTDKSHSLRQQKKENIQGGF